MIINGNPVSPGIALGKLFVYNKPADKEVRREHFAPGEEDAHYGQFRAALDVAIAELDKVIEQMGADGEVDKADIFEAHKALITDEELLEAITSGIRNDKKIPEYAVDDAFGVFIGILGGVDDPLISARTADLRDTRDRLLRILRHEVEINLSRLDEPVIIAAHDLLPSDTATLDRTNVLGIITEAGGSTSHTAIIANSYSIPAILGTGEILSALLDGMVIGMDATTGEIFVEPSPEETSRLMEKAKREAAATAAEQSFLALPASTKDGTLFETGINIGSDEKLPAFAHSDFVGLFRTEFLYMDGDHLPSEDEQFAAYRRVLENAAGKPVTLRTLDIGGDKTLSYMELPQEENPFLGNRALRLCFDMSDIFRVQLRAALRAAAYGEMWIMFPMVGGLEDIRRARQIYEGIKDELDREKIPRGEPKFGIMIEIPAIACIADLAAEEVDFASIGTNDLCQYLCAADRMNASVTAYYRSLSPAMIRILGFVAEAFNKAGKPLSVCGEMAGEVFGAILLAGLGYRKLSMSGGRLAKIKAALSRITIAEAESVAHAAQTACTEADVIEMLEKRLS